MAELVSVSEFARAWGVSPKTVVRWCDSGRITYEVSPGGQRRIYRKHLPSVEVGRPERAADEAALAAAGRRR